jgi:hypothetical protein
MESSATRRFNVEAGDDPIFFNYLRIAVGKGTYYHQAGSCASVMRAW